jgi:hypothetical protein
MLNRADPSWPEDRRPFALCEDLGELLLVVHQLLGLEAVDRLLAEVTNTKEALRDAASKFAAIGLKPLAQLVRKHARRARPNPWGFKRHTQSALAHIARRRAERGQLHCESPVTQR